MLFTLASMRTIILLQPLLTQLGLISFATISSAFSLCRWAQGQKAILSDNDHQWSHPIWLAILWFDCLQSTSVKFSHRMSASLQCREVRAWSPICGLWEQTELLEGRMVHFWYRSSTWAVRVCCDLFFPGQTTLSKYVQNVSKCSGLTTGQCIDDKHEREREIQYIHVYSCIFYIVDKSHLRGIELGRITFVLYLL